MGRFGSLMPKSGSDLPFWRALIANRFLRTNSNILPGTPSGLGRNHAAPECLVALLPTAIVPKMAAGALSNCTESDVS